MRRGGLREIIYKERGTDEAQEDPYWTTSARLHHLRKMFRQEGPLEEAHEDTRKSGSLSDVSGCIGNVRPRPHSTSGTLVFPLRLSYVIYFQRRNRGRL